MRPVLAVQSTLSRSYIKLRALIPQQFKYTLLMLELPWLLASEFPSNGYSLKSLKYTHSNSRTSYEVCMVAWTFKFLQLKLRRFKLRLNKFRRFKYDNFKFGIFNFKNLHPTIQFWQLRQIKLQQLKIQNLKLDS